MVTITSSSLMTQAKALAETLLRADIDHSFINALPPSFMQVRPRNLAESLRHGLSVARILRRWQAEPALQAAGLLHSFVWKGTVSAQQIASACDDRVAFLCGEYCRILQQVPQPQPRGKQEVIRRAKLFIATHRDPALAFLGVASSWDHFELAYQNESSFSRGFVAEAQSVLIPMLEVLGMWDMKQQVEKWLVLQGPNRQHYEYLLKRIAQTEDTRRQAFEEITSKLGPWLPTAQFGPKPFIPASIYTPQFSESASAEALQQKLKIDILVDTEEDCYLTLAHIHRLWPPSEGGNIVDYIGDSKPNGYRCLQTRVIVPLGHSHIQAHFHIRTWEMDEINRWGLAALELRKREQSPPVAQWGRQWQAAYPKIRAATMGSLPETLAVFSPQGQLFQFQQGSTVIDYAYHVHSDVAHQCKRFRLNGEVVGPSTALRHLDLIELERDPQFPGPTEAWLNAARTDRARNHIKRFLKRRRQGPFYGRTLFDQQLQSLEQHYRIGIPEHRVEAALSQATHYLDFERIEDLLTAIAAGRLTSERILHPLFAEEITRQIQLPPTLRLRPNQLRLARCCRPCPGDEIVGRVRKRDGLVVNLKIHQANCKHIHSMEDVFTISWRPQPRLKTVARLEVTALDSDGLLGDMLPVIYARLPEIILHKLEAVGRNGMARLSFMIEAKDQALLDQIAQDIRHSPDHTINEVRQMQLMFSEREELGRLTTPTTFNPYRRLPVQNREMLFGRSEELAQIYELLTVGTGAIFLRGQKRVGKTSLLLHLKAFYLEHASIEPIFIDFQILSHMSGPHFFYEIANAIYNELRRDARISDVGPPLSELFEASPTSQLVDYLTHVRSQFASSKLVLLIDEFSRTIDVYQQKPDSDDIFQQWRGILQQFCRR